MKITKPKNQCIEVPLWFIMDYMPKAPSGYTHVYLYLLALSYKSHKDVNLERVAKTLKMLYSEVISALGYWNEQGVLNFKEDEELTFLMEPLSDQLSLESLYGSLMSEQPKPIETSIETPIESSISTLDHTSKIEPSNAPVISELTTLPETKLAVEATIMPPLHQRNFLNASRPAYTTEEISIYKKQSQEYSDLVQSAEEILGPISLEYQKLLYGLYDWLGMSFELIKCLLQYCAKQHKTSLRYIETTAIGWIEKDGITTVEEAQAKIEADQRYYKVLKKLGIKRDIITPVDKAFIDKWIDTWAFDLEMVLKACEKTVTSISNPNLNYTDKILSAWQKDHIKTLEDIKIHDNAYQGKKALESTSNKGSTWVTPKKKTRFNTMDSRTWDFEELDRLEDEYIDRKLKGEV